MEESQSANVKIGEFCSVEDLHSKDHQVVCDRTLCDFTVLGPMFSRPQRGAEQPLEHAVDGFDLPPLTVFQLVEVRCHAASPATRGKFVRRPTTRWRDDRSHTVCLAGVLVSWLAVVAGIGQQRLDRHAASRLLPRWPVMLVVRTWANSGNHRQNKSARAIAGNPCCGKVKALPLLDLPGVLATFRVV